MTSYRDRMLAGEYDADKQSLGKAISRASASAPGGSSLAKPRAKTTKTTRRSSK